MFLDPTFRLPGVSAQMSQALYDLAIRTGALGAFDMDQIRVCSDQARKLLSYVRQEKERIEMH